MKIINNMRAEILSFAILLMSLASGVHAVERSGGTFGTPIPSKVGQVEDLLVLIRRFVEMFILLPLLLIVVVTYSLWFLYKSKKWNTEDLQRLHRTGRMSLLIASTIAILLFMMSYYPDDLLYSFSTIDPFWTIGIIVILATTVLIYMIMPIYFIVYIRKLYKNKKSLSNGAKYKNEK